MNEFLSSHRIELVAFLACAGLMTFIFELVRRNAVKEKYSFLWFATGISLMLLTLKRDWLTSLSKLLGIYYPPSALFLVLSLFMILILIHYSIVLTKLLSQNQKLAQKVALLETEINQMRPRESDQPYDDAA